MNRDPVVITEVQQRWRTFDTAELSAFAVDATVLSGHLSAEKAAAGWGGGYHAQNLRREPGATFHEDALGYTEPTLLLYLCHQSCLFVWRESVVQAISGTALRQRQLGRGQEVADGVAASVVPRRLPRSAWNVKARYP